MENSSVGSGRPPALLVVDDNPGDARLVKEAFSETQFADELHTVSDGDEALDFLYQRGEYTDARRPDLILLDWHLPGTSGESVLTELKDDPDLNRIPIIVMTGSQDEREVVRSYQKHANACIAKPSDPEAFIDAIHVLEKFWLTVARLPNLDEEGEDNGSRQA